MTKYIIELEDDIKYLIINGRADNRCYTLVRPVAELEVLNSDYINEHYGELQDDAYQRGYDDGKKYFANGCVGCQYEDDESRVNPCCECARVCNDHYIPKHSDRIEVGDEVGTRDGAPSHTFLVTKITDSHVYGISNDGSWNYWTKDEVTKTGKHYDIQSILEAMCT